jgi:hypothetical protein
VSARAIAQVRLSSMSTRGPTSLSAFEASSNGAISTFPEREVPDRFADPDLAGVHGLERRPRERSDNRRPRLPGRRWPGSLTSSASVCPASRTRSGRELEVVRPQRASRRSRRDERRPSIGRCGAR